jgi:catechol 2,3-dioxygenase-like lactoylglutathione lyase family enzyme
MRLAHLSAPSGVGIELFQFIDPPNTAPENPFEYWRQGIFHVCFTVDDLEASIERLTAAGGVLRTQIHEIRPGTRVAYCQDPWGTIIELSTGAYAQITGTAK